MRISMLAVAAVAAVLAAPSLTVSASADDARVGPPGVTVEEHHGPPAVVEEHRRPGVTIHETEGRKNDCITHSESTTHNGTTVTQKERDCAR